MLRRTAFVGWMLALFLLMAACAPVVAPTVDAPAADASATTAPVALSGDLLVHAAASLTDAFSMVGEQFSAAHPGTQVTFNFAGSQQLAQQLAAGAPGDVFASANQRQMDAAVEAGRVEAGAAQTFVRNRLVVIVPAENQAGLTTLHDLTQPGIKLVLAAAEVPVGTYSLDFLDKAAADAEYGATYREAVLGNVVSYEENVRAVLSKIVLGEADAGIVYTSDITGDAANQVGRIDIPDELNTVAQYPIAVVLDAPNPDLARAFVDYVLGPEGQAILADYGFIPAAGQ